MNTEEQIEHVKKILLSHGIKINIGGCVCCGSPWVKLEYNGQIILDEDDRCTITMID